MPENPKNDGKNRFLKFFNQLGLDHPLINFFSLGFLKATDAVILLLLIPIIIHRVGIANFGIIAFVQVILNYGKTIIDYGFHITGVRLIALNKENREKLSGLLSDILFSRLLLCLIFTLFLFLSIQLIPFLKEREWVFYLGFLLPLGHVFFIDWFFIGMQKAHFIALANLVIKLLFAASVLLFIQVPEDFVFLLAFQGLSGLVVGLVVVMFTCQYLRLHFKIPSVSAIRNFLINDFKLLLSNLAIEFNASYSILILSALTTDVITGYFNVMYKLVQPLRFLLVIFSQAIFPKVCEKTREGWHSMLAFLKTAFVSFFWLPVVCTLLIVCFAGPIYAYFAKSADPDLLAAFSLYLLAPILVLANIPAYQILLAYDKKSDYTAVYLISMSLKLILDYCLIKFYGLQGLIISILLIEAFITLGLWLMVKKNSHQLINQAYPTNK
ncbi:MAG: polisoprenol-linked O-antigen transporter [Saprospiraceae bacterium]|nr:MAG: polisoprenol-linked O-antigen transporter [Saprospiraceae bacterium]